MESYWYYLARLSDVQLLRAQRRITDINGRIISCSGEPISSEQVASIQKAYTVSEIEQVVSFQGSVDKQWLFQCLLGMIDSDPSLSDFYIPDKHERLLMDACECLQLRKPLIFRLGVMSRCRPQIFKRSLFCAWMGLLLFDYMKRDKEDIDCLFEASIAHDIGMLDLPIELAEERRDDKQRHSLEYYQHTKYAAEFVSSTGSSSKRVYDAIIQHHEYIDGSGFPQGLCGVRLSEFGQIINMFDSLYVIYSNKFKPIGRSIADLVPIVEMNSVTRFGYSAKQLVELLKTGKRTKHVMAEPSHLKHLVYSMKTLFLYVDHANFIIQEFTNRVGFRHEDKGLSALQNGFFHIALTIHKSEYINTEYVTEMSTASFDKQSQHYNEIEDATLMMKEVVFHIHEFKKHLGDYILSCNNDSVRQAAHDALYKLDSNLLDVNL